MEVMHGGQYISAVGALLPTGFAQAAGLEALQHGVEQQVFCTAGEETGEELTPGARRMLPSRRTAISVSRGRTVSRCAANTRVGPPPTPLRRPITFPIESM
jgi:hypothetical protein